MNGWILFSDEERVIGECKRLENISFRVEYEKFNKKNVLCQNKVVYL